VLLEPDVPARVVGSFDWPIGSAPNGNSIDMRSLPDPDAEILDFYYATALPEGWCALTDGKSGVGLGLSFDPGILRSVWWFASYNGWRGHRVFIVEPCTGYPYKLEEAIAAGNCTTLPSGGCLETEIVAAVFQGLSGISRVESSGDVRAMKRPKHEE